MRTTWPEVSNIVSLPTCPGCYLPARAGSSVLGISNDGCDVSPIAPWNEYHHGQSQPKNEVERQQPHKNA